MALMGITAMQWVEGALWLDGPEPSGWTNQLLTVALIPLALLGQAWGPLLGSAYDVPIRGRRLPFYLLLIAGLSMVVAARVVYQPSITQVTPGGHLNWWSPQNPPFYPGWAYGLWALVIGAPFLLWWRPLWQSLLIVFWGWLCATVAYFVSDNPASYWCFYVSFYAVFVIVYAVMAGDEGDKSEGVERLAGKSAPE